VVVAGGVCAFIAIAIGEPMVGVILAGAWAAMAAAIWTRGLRPRVILTAHTLKILDYWNDATILLRDIAYCRADRSGLEIVCVDGRMKRAPYPTKSLIAGWTGRRTGADAAVQLIMARAEAAQIEPAQPVGRMPWWPFS
jgi:hypothetical protein